MQIIVKALDSNQRERATRKGKEALHKIIFSFNNKDNKPTTHPKNGYIAGENIKMSSEKWHQKYVERKLGIEEQKIEIRQRINLSTMTQIKSFSDLLHFNKG